MAKCIETRRELGKQSISSLTGSCCHFSQRILLSDCLHEAVSYQAGKNPPGVDEQ